MIMTGEKYEKENRTETKLFIPLGFNFSAQDRK